MVQTLLHSDLEVVNSWCRDNRLTVKPTFYGASLCRDLSVFALKLGGKTLHVVEKFNYMNEPIKEFTVLGIKRLKKHPYRSNL